VIGKEDDPNNMTSSGKAQLAGIDTLKRLPDYMNYECPLQLPNSEAF